MKVSAMILAGLAVSLTCCKAMKSPHEEGDNKNTSRLVRQSTDGGSKSPTASTTNSPLPRSPSRQRKRAKSPGNAQNDTIRGKLHKELKAHFAAAGNTTPSSIRSKTGSHSKKNRNGSPTTSAKQHREEVTLARKNSTTRRDGTKPKVNNSTKKVTFAPLPKKSNTDAWYHGCTRRSGKRWDDLVNYCGSLEPKKWPQEADKFVREKASSVSGWWKSSNPSGNTLNKDRTTRKGSVAEQHLADPARPENAWHQRCTKNIGKRWEVLKKSVSGHLDSNALQWPQNAMTYCGSLPEKAKAAAIDGWNKTGTFVSENVSGVYDWYKGVDEDCTTNQGKAIDATR